MERFEMVETLRNRANVTYEEARQVLEASGWDLVEAMVRLENQGKTGRGKAGMEQGKTDKARQAREQAEGLLSRFLTWVKNLVDLGLRNHFAVSKDGRRVMTVPVLVAVLLLLVLNGLFVFGLIVAFVIGYRFRYLPEKEMKKDSQDMEEAGQAAEQILNHKAVNSFGESA